MEPDKQYYIRVTQWKPKRSHSQNNLMWKWNQEIADFVNETGLAGEETIDSDDIHELLVSIFWGKIVKEINGRIIERRFETSKFKVDQMCQHLEKIEQFAATKGINLTQPYDYRYAMYGEK